MIDLNAAEQRREIRVFVSSTFVDMQRERDHLMKVVFPRIRKLARERGVEFTEVDLRWGVTREQAEQGRVIEICLNEIERCRPYFIGLLGHRYGWAPAADDYHKHEAILRTFPWVRHDLEQGLSITEMEIQYGVLRNPEMLDRAFFYLRDEAASPEQFREHPGSPDEVKLSRLKSTIQQKAACRSFSDLAQLEEALEADFTAVLESGFPAVVPPSPLERARMDHAAFARSRLRVYVGGETYFGELDKHVEGSDGPLVLTGEAGSGKSALLANWIARYQQHHPDTFILYHFVGGAPDSTGHHALIRRIMEEMKDRFGVQEDIPTDQAKLTERLPFFLAPTPNAQRWVLVIDALNQLQDQENARWLGWLPTFFPENVRVLFSTLPGEALDALRKRGCRELDVNPLTMDERRTLIRNYLGVFTKEISPETIERIAADPESENPLILRTLLDELRVWGVHEKLDERIDYYLRTNGAAEFFDAVLTRMEEDYETERPGMVGEALSLLWAARRGLSEKEILDLTGVPALIWSPLYNALANHLVSRGGLLDFSHDFLRQAIERRYLPDEERKKQVHLRLAAFFERDRLGVRTLDELPWQLREAAEWGRFRDYLTDVRVFMALNKVTSRTGLVENLSWAAIHTEVWNLLEENTRAYTGGLIRDGEKKKGADILDVVGGILRDCGVYPPAVRIWERCLTIRETILGPNHPNVATGLNGLAELYRAQGQYAKAEPLYQRALEIWEAALGPNHHNVATGLNNLAALHQAQGQYAQAEPLYLRSLAIEAAALGLNHPSVARTLNNLVALYQAQGQYAKAEPLCQRALEIWEAVLGPNHPDVATVLSNLAELYRAQRQYAKAESLCLRALEIREAVLGPNHPNVATSLNNLAELYRAQRQYAKAEPLYLRALVIEEAALGPNHPDLATVLMNLAKLYQAQSQYVKAESLCLRALEIKEVALGSNHPNVATVLNDLAGLYYAQGQYAKAEPLCLRALDIFEVILGPNHPFVANVLECLALLYKEMNRPQNATDCAARAKRIRGSQ